MPNVPNTRACPTCAGCGRVATDAARTPWTTWLATGSRLAVTLGAVRPIVCPGCSGTGRVAETTTLTQGER